ncbi:helix-turn-helix transcriptional regulator [Mycolicibacterium sp. 018/SC-01/001]|uniref:helix-turn-helix domain-containing protein n=1 Tax=Mycolicibacterium sp. 018/SC-01/001 TaxID=2592069 RepID=UPI00117F2585|nr:helix-turn-helix domain-containing protein [Mycolicibacterium sp. 018/SC-01/001]TRW89153.1 helix-turn-helix transcriptional regulator [Mycolicibacterium sp. 018/SC-01/001]
MSEGTNLLGDYLRARRGQVNPQDVGLVAGPRRRVSGLRRAELATLAGISAEYYLRLEQGRDKNPSPQILDALARALQLDIKASEYLHQLAGGAEPAARGAAGDDTAADGLDDLIEQWTTPSLVANRYQDVLAANAVARALSPGFTPGVNFLRWRLTEPAAKEFFADWDEATDIAVSGLREVAAGASADARMRALVEELSGLSARFVELWARADVGYRAGVTVVRHPVVGELQLHRHRLAVPHSGGQHLIVFSAAPGSPSQQALERLLEQSRGY